MGEGEHCSLLTEQVWHSGFRTIDHKFDKTGQFTLGQSLALILVSYQFRVCGFLVIKPTHMPMPMMIMMVAMIIRMVILMTKITKKQRDKGFWVKIYQF